MEISKIKGINEKRNADFNKLGVYDTADLIKFFPRGYVDLRQKQLLKYVYHNDFALTAARIVSLPPNFYARKRTSVVKAVCEQEGMIFSAVWFNQPYVVSKLKVGEEYLFFGRVQNKFGDVSIINPTFELCEKNFRLKGIVPQYSCKGSLNQKIIRDSVRLAVDLEKPKSVIPFSFQKKYELSDLYYAYKNVHNPETFEIAQKAADRIAVEEYFSLISAFKFIKGDKSQVRINKYDCSSKEIVEFVATRFSFDFTEGQKKAVNEIFSDMTGEMVMNRLLQGDVGSGKTAVSNCAIFVAVKSGFQAVMLAPTEVLARQNFEVIKKIFFDYNVELLVGSTPLKEKKEIKNSLKNGKINILVGTHAVLEDDVEFKKLALCVCDEQQRFGVAQRSNLLSKGVAPDVLVMSATPIPRTLSLIFYGDLDITTITDKPNCRQSVQTAIVPKTKYADMIGFVRKEIENGNQAYFVCPKIEGDDEGTVISVTELYEELNDKLKGIEIGLLHGRMKEKEKNAVMQAFKDGRTKILVSTTVIEVGVDVPNATVMVITSAERFGLSQLHQLRGRVGRGDKKSYCFLLSGAETGVAFERLKVLVKNGDGFKIAEYDYKLRGSGDFMGSRQSGKFMKDLGNLNYDTQSIFLAKKISDEVFESGADLDRIKEIAIEKYNKLKDITLN